MIRDEIITYCNDVVEGRIIACNAIKLACKRTLEDFERQDLYWNETKVDKCFRFIGLFSHLTDTSKKFKLEAWEKWIVGSLVGFYRKDTDTRKYQKALILIARKNGKSTLVAALLLYFMLCDGECQADILLCANSRQQAKDVDFRIVKEFAKQIDPQQKVIKIYRDRIYCPKLNSQLIVLSADGKAADGYNCFCGCVDEAEESADLKMKELIETSQGMRKNSLSLVISTAGYHKDYPLFDLYTTFKEILRGEKDDDSQFVAIYELDEEDDFRDENVWIKANPNLGVTILKSKLHDAVTKAVNTPSERNGLLIKHFNKWSESLTAWISDERIYGTMQKLDIDELSKKFQMCYMGIDLAAVCDLAAVSYLFYDDVEDKYYFKTFYYLPAETIANSPNAQKYQQWVRQGYLIACNGNVTDYDVILNDILKIRNNNELAILDVAYDSWNSTQFAISATEQGLPMNPYGQSLGNFNKPTKELERLILQGKIIIDKNPITRWCFQNVVLKTDYNDNCKPDKTSRDNKIDGVISMCQSLGSLLRQPRYSNTI